MARDVDYLTQIGRREHVPTNLLEAIRVSNSEHARWARRTIETLLDEDDGLGGHTIGIWGLAYKPGTDTLRRSNAVELCAISPAQGPLSRHMTLGFAPSRTISPTS